MKKFFAIFIAVAMIFTFASVAFAANDGVITVTTDPNDFASCLEALQEKGFESVSAAVSMVPSSYQAIDAETARKCDKLTDKLEEDDDVQNVYTNIEYPDGYEAE